MGLSGTPLCPFCSGGGEQAKLHLSVHGHHRQRGFLYHLVDRQRVLCPDPRRAPIATLEPPPVLVDDSMPDVTPGIAVLPFIFLLSMGLAGVTCILALALGRVLYCVPAATIFLVGLAGFIKHGRTV